MVANSRRPLVAMGKHLCGAATGEITVVLIGCNTSFFLLLLAPLLYPLYLLSLLFFFFVNVMALLNLIFVVSVSC